MNTNIVRLPENKFGKLVDTAMYCCYGTCFEDADFDICEIFELVGGGYAAVVNGMLFSIEETNWNGNPRKYRLPSKRGKHSRSRSKVAYRIALWERECDELPF